MLKITNLRNGTVLNAGHGRESGDRLEIMVEGFMESPGPVTVNGVMAQASSQMFRVPAFLNRQFNEIILKTSSNYGEFQQSVKVVWDKKSFKRYNFFIDDNIFFLTDICKKKPASLFDHFYLKRLKDIHRKYGAKFTLNLFYRNDHFQFELKDFTDRYKEEWRDNSGWLKLSFHAYSEFPDRPYQNATPEKLAADYDLIHSEIVRFAGEKTFQPPAVVHWGMVLPEAFSVLKDRGVKTLCGEFINAKTFVGEKDRDSQATDIGYYRDRDTSLYLLHHHLLYDFEHELLFIKGDACCNLLSREEIVEKLTSRCRIPAHDTLSLVTHEQYSFDYYPNFIPDHLDRIETAVRIATEHGYKPVFFHDGFLGNPSWD
ncbi:MAG: hypothetical protein NT118_10975 [Lentisphaerae bacterium]|nr:hypothetical protein [Lentisphaerota bacterium]